MGKFSRRQPVIDQNRRGVVVILLAVLIFVVGLFHASAYKRSLQKQGASSERTDVIELLNLPIR